MFGIVALFVACAILIAVYVFMVIADSRPVVDAPVDEYADTRYRWVLDMHQGDVSAACAYMDEHQGALTA